MVRYVTGLVATSKAADLTHLTHEEVAMLQAPVTCERDFMTEEQILSDAFAKLGMPLRVPVFPVFMP